MASFEDVLPYLKRGSRIRREGWPEPPNVGLEVTRAPGVFSVALTSYQGAATIKVWRAPSADVLKNDWLVIDDGVAKPRGEGNDE